MKKLDHKLTLIALFSLAILLVVEAIGNYDALPRRLALMSTCFLTLIIFLIIYRVLQKKHSIVLPWFVAWSVAVGVWLDAAGNFVLFYRKYWWWDNLAHFGGSLSASISFFVILYYFEKFGRIKIGRVGLGLATISLVTLLGVFYEFTEWWGDVLFNLHRVGDRFDTVSDLFFNFLAGVAVALIAAWILRRLRSKT